MLVGFGAETGEAGLERKRRMLADKNLDLVVYNDVSVAGIGFDAADNEVMLVSRAGERQLARAPKEEIAAGIVDEVERLLKEDRGSDVGIPPPSPRRPRRSTGSSRTSRSSSTRPRTRSGSACSAWSPRGT